jgi:gluconate kinase
MCNSILKHLVAPDLSKVQLITQLPDFDKITKLDLQGILTPLRDPESSSLLQIVKVLGIKINGDEFRTTWIHNIRKQMQDRINSGKESVITCHILKCKPEKPDLLFGLINIYDALIACDHTISQTLNPREPVFMRSCICSETLHVLITPNDVHIQVVIKGKLKEDTWITKLKEYISILQYDNMNTKIINLSVRKRFTSDSFFHKADFIIVSW